MSTTVFLSYARADDGEPYDPATSFVAKLHADLTNAGFDVWFDRVSLPSRQLRFQQQIKDAIRQRDRVVYVAGPRAAVSDYVRAEWEFALECDKSVIPILRNGDFDVVPGALCLLHCDDFRDDRQYPVQLAKLVANLRLPEVPLGKLFAVPNLPPHFLARPDILRRLKDAIQVDLKKPVVISNATSRVGVQGMGGIGKSVLAAVVARDREIRRSYPDGVIWVSFGQIKPDPEQRVVTQLMRDVARHLGDAGTFQTVAQGQGVLRELLLTKAVLLVLDDVWKASDAQPFDVLGPRCRALVTTRDAGIIRTLHGKLYPVDLFSEAESLALLASAVETMPDQLPPAAREVVKECDGLPLAVALCGGMAKKRRGEWDTILRRLQRADLDKIADREAINEQHRSIYRAMQVSVEALASDEQRRFAELSVFVTDQEVPESAIATLWAHTGNLDDLDAEDLLINLSERALIRLDRREANAGRPAMRHMSMHDLLYDFTVRTVGDREGLNQSLLDAYRIRCPDGWYSGPNDGYFFRNLCHHLSVATGNWDESTELLCDLRFVEARCRVGEVFELQADYRLAWDSLPEAQQGLKERREQEERVARWIGELVRYSQAWSERRDRIARHEPVREPEPKLPEPVPACRMWTEEEIERESDRIRKNPTRFDRLTVFAGFVKGECYPLIEHGTRPGFVVQHAFNHAPGGPVHAAAARLLPQQQAPLLLRRWPASARWNPKPACLQTLAGHKNLVNSVSVTPDGRRAVSGGFDRAVRVWDLDSGACLLTLLEHSGEVNSVIVTPDGRRAVSGSDDGTVRVWDLESGVCVKTLAGHSDKITSVSVTPDGRRALSGSWDKSVRVWDLESGKCLQELAGHSHWVESVSVTPDGRRAVSGSCDKSVRVWDLETGRCLRTLAVDFSEGDSVSVTPSGRRAVLGAETVRVWDLESGACLLTLEGANMFVSVTPDGRRAVSASFDNTLQVWDLESGACIRHLAGQSRITSVSVTADGRGVVSGSFDSTVQVWDLESRTCSQELAGHSDKVESMSVTPDGRRAVSGGYETKVRVWDLDSGECVQQLEGHSVYVESVSVTPDGRRAVSGGWDKTVWAWDLESGKCLQELAGHSNEVKSVSVTPDGRRAVSGSNDKTVRVWDLESGACLHKLAGHSDRVKSVIVTPDGRRAISGGDDKTVRVWDLESGACLHTLVGHTYSLVSLYVTPDGRRAVSGGNDNTVRVWDLESGECLQVLEKIDADVCGLSITPDGCSVVSGSWDRTVQVWDLKTAQCLQKLVGHNEKVTSLSVTPDGRRVVSGGDDNTVRMWDLESGQCVGLFVAPAPPRVVASGLQFLATGTEAGEVLIAEVRNLPTGQAITVEIDSSDTAHEASLRRGLDHCRRAKGADHADTRAHLLALTVHLEKTGRRDDARTLRQEHAQPSSPSTVRSRAVRVGYLSWTRAAEANRAYQRALAEWKALPIWKRAFIKKPSPPTGI